MATEGLSEDDLFQGFHREWNSTCEANGHKPVPIEKTDRMLRDALNGRAAIYRDKCAALGKVLKCRLGDITERASRNQGQAPRPTPSMAREVGPITAPGLVKPADSGAAWEQIGRLGDTADVLSGIWKLFYVVPLFNRPDAEPIIRYNLIFFKNIRHEYCELFMVGQSRQFIGRVYGHDAQLYYIWKEITPGVELSFMLSNMPTSRNQAIAGIVTLLDNPFYNEDAITTRPAMSTLCFGEKYGIYTFNNSICL
jgi:hypothetical protein